VSRSPTTSLLGIDGNHRSRELRRENNSGEREKNNLQLCLCFLLWSKRRSSICCIPSFPDLSPNHRIWRSSLFDLNSQRCSYSWRPPKERSGPLRWRRSVISSSLLFFSSLTVLMLFPESTGGIFKSIGRKQSPERGASAGALEAIGRIVDTSGDDYSR
jgi:hypothetical protein